MKSIIPVLLTFFCLFYSGVEAQTDQPVRIGIVGLVHDHVHNILGRENKGDITIVGIAEPNRQLAERYAAQYGFSMDLVYPSLDEMLEKTHPEAVTTFTTIYDHLEVVKKCAPRHVHVMVEKPLAVSLDHARQMERLARENHILLLTNYETTWYTSNHGVYDMAVTQEKLGDLRKLVIHDGHEGPIEIGCSKEFTDWLCDPKYNGAGALMDFGCYGANLSTWLMRGQRPDRVTAVTQQIKPEKYPKVDDEATIVLSYPQAQTIIQASWNWPFSRKDMEVYGTRGYAFAADPKTIKADIKDLTLHGEKKVASLTLKYNDPFSLLADMVRGKAHLDKFDPTSLENNMIVMDILEAAKRSADRGEAIELPVNSN